jgi:hypothetical protein
MDMRRFKLALRQDWSVLSLLVFLVGVALPASGQMRGEMNHSAPRSATAKADTASRVLTLEDFLKLVRSESPDLLAEKARVEAALVESEGVRIMPPMVGLMQMRQGGTSTTGLEVSQELPFPTKISKEKKARELESAAKKEKSRLASTTVLADARSAYVAYWAAWERARIAGEKRAWLKEHVRLVRAATRSESAAQLHSLETEEQADLAENERLAAEAALIEKQAELKIFAPSLALDGLEPEAPKLEPYALVRGGEEPALLTRQKELAAKEALEGYKNDTLFPNLFLRLRAFEGNESAPQSQELMVGVSLPFVFSSAPRAEASEAVAERRMAEAELLKTRARLEASRKSLTKKEELLRAQLTNLEEKLLPRARLKTRIISNYATRNIEGLDEHRMVMLSFLDLQSKIVELKEQRENVRAELVRVTGAEIDETGREQSRGEK